jgi:hypothetical protein
MYTPAALRFPVVPLASPLALSLWILIGNSSGNLFPVRASSDTVPPLSWLGPSLFANEANAIKYAPGRRINHFLILRSGYITDETAIKA